MQAAQVVEIGRVEVSEAPTPRPEEGQVLVRGTRASICGSDLHIVFDPISNRKYPAPIGSPGHEAVGQVVDSRSPDFGEGDWVLAVPVPAVARCYAQEFVIDATSLIKLPLDQDPNKLLLAQQLGTTVYAFRRHWPSSLDASGKTVAIQGAGSAGLFFTQLARLAGFEKVIISDRSSLRLQLAKDFGADVLVNIDSQSFVDTVLEESSGVGADLVIEAVGYDATRIDCLKAVRREGRIGYFGFPESGADPETWSFSLAWQKIPSIEVVTGTQREPGLRSFHEAIDHIVAGRVNVDPFLDPVYPLEQIQAGFDAAHEQRGGKIAVDLA